MRVSGFTFGTLSRRKQWCCRNMSSSRDFPLSAMVTRGMLSASLIQAGRQQHHPIQSHPIQAYSATFCFPAHRTRPANHLLRVATTVQTHQVKLQGAVVSFKMLLGKISIGLKTPLCYWRQLIFQTKICNANQGLFFTC